MQITTIQFFNQSFEAAISETETENFTDMLYQKMNVAENIFFEEHPEYKK